MSNVRMQAILSGFIARNKDIDYHNLISNLLTNISEIDNFTLHDGLIGIVWAVEYSYYHRLTDFDTNKILHDIDDLLYRRVMQFQNDLRFSSEDALGLLIYYHRRLKNGRHYNDIYRNYSILPCLRLITYTIDQHLFSVDPCTTTDDILTSLISLKYAHISKTFQIGNFEAVLFYILDSYANRLANIESVSPQDCITFFMYAISLCHYTHPILTEKYRATYRNQITNIDRSKWTEEEETIIMILNDIYASKNPFKDIINDNIPLYSPLSIMIILVLLDVDILPSRF